MATVPRPGMGPTIRTEADFSESARSSARFTTCAIFTPVAGSNSYEVMIGPGLTWTMRPSTSKSWSFRRMVSAFSCSSSRVRLSSDVAGTLRSPTGGSWNAAAPPPPKSKVSCQASPCSARRPRGREGSTTTGGAKTSGSTAAIAAADDAVTAGRSAAAGARRRLSLVNRVEVTRSTAAYETRVTQSTPIGTAATSASHVPTLPKPEWSRPVVAWPTRPPPMLPLLTLVACVKSPAALASSKASPPNGAQPRTMSGRRNAEAPHAPSRIGRRRLA